VPLSGSDSRIHSELPRTKCGQNRRTLLTQTDQTGLKLEIIREANDLFSLNEDGQLSLMIAVEADGSISVASSSGERKLCESKILHRFHRMK
jgi:hypothetical protein